VSWRSLYVSWRAVAWPLARCLFFPFDWKLSYFISNSEVAHTLYQNSNKGKGFYCFTSSASKWVSLTFLPFFLVGFIDFLLFCLKRRVGCLFPFFSILNRLRNQDTKLLYTQQATKPRYETCMKLAVRPVFSQPAISSSYKLSYKNLTSLLTYLMKKRTWQLTLATVLKLTLIRIGEWSAKSLNLAFLVIDQSYNTS